MKIKNADTIEHTWCGQLVQPNSYYEVQDIELPVWANNSALLADIANSIAIVNDGDIDITDVNAAIDYLKSKIPPVVSIKGPHSKTGATVTESSIRCGCPHSDSVTFVSPDFTDRTSWYQNSVKVTDGVLDDSGDGLTFGAANAHWIDVLGSKLTYDSKGLLQRDGTWITHREYIVVVKVDSVLQISGYTINFVSGTITFGSSQSGKTVTATYYHNDNVANRSEWLISVPEDGVVTIQHVEIQFSQNVDFTGKKILHQTWVGGTLQNYVGLNWDTTSSYCKEWTEYRKVRDLINWCNNEYPVLPMAGNTEFTKDVLVFPFKYLLAPILPPGSGVIVRLALENDAPFTCEIATITVYTTIKTGCLFYYGSEGHCTVNG
jgi:hypothetical protein